MAFVPCADLWDAHAVFGSCFFQIKEGFVITVMSYLKNVFEEHKVSLTDFLVDGLCHIASWLILPFTCLHVHITCNLKWLDAFNITNAIIT